MKSITNLLYNIITKSAKYILHDERMISLINKYIFGNPLDTGAVIGTAKTGSDLKYFQVLQQKREVLNGKIKNRIGKRLNATIENKIVAFVYVLCSLLFLS